jgi:uncharacterized membrane protein YeaQ/YmgE (transglycosylase-associated protein family)
MALSIAARRRVIAFVCDRTRENQAMALLAELLLSPGGLISWIAVGLISGWRAGVAMGGGGYGILSDIMLGLVGAVLGGLIAGFLISGEAGFWGSIVIALVGACFLIGISRAITPRRAPRL